MMQENGDYQIVTIIGPNVGVPGNAREHRVTLSAGQSWSLDVDNGEATTTILPCHRYSRAVKLSRRLAE